MTDHDRDPDFNYFDNIVKDNTCLKYNSSSFNNISDFDEFSVLSFNIRSFHKNIDEFIASVNVFKDKIDVLILSETWLNDSTVSLCNLEGYNAFHSIRSSRTCGGVSIFVKDTYPSFEKSCINNDFLELISVNIKLPNSSYIDVVGIYRPPSGNIYTFNGKLEEIFTNLKLNLNFTIVGGDFNICLFKSDTDLSTGAFSDLMSSFSLVPHITIPTRVYKACCTLAQIRPEPTRQNRTEQNRRAMRTPKQTLQAGTKVNTG